MEEKPLLNAAILSISNSKYKWRTLEALATELKANPDELRSLLDSSDEVIKSSRPNSNGKPLYSTRNKYSENTPLRKRLVSAILNRAD